MIKKCIYTTIIGNYDNLYTSFNGEKTDGWDYICFTDNRNLKSNFWKIIYVNKPKDLSNAKFARNIKIEWYNWVGEYDVHIWKDANILIKTNLDNFLKLKENFKYLIFNHWQRNCLYDEGQEIIKLGRLNSKDVYEQLINYNNENYPQNNGLVETGIMIRENINENIKFSKLWWNEILKYTHRDQLSFNYVLWKSSIKIKIIDSQLRNNNMFTLKLHKI